MLRRCLLAAVGTAFCLAPFVMTDGVSYAIPMASPVTKTLSVPADTPFLDSGVTIKRGQSVLVTATGIISYGSLNPACAGATITPNGCSSETTCPVAGGCGELVGRLGDGPPFAIGSRRVVEGPGVLWLGINDTAGAFGDNTGAFAVKIVAAAPTFNLIHILPSPKPGERLDNLFLGSTISYALGGWDQSGGPISISYDDKIVGTLPAPTPTQEQIVGTFKITKWVTQGTRTDPDFCQGTLVATQGSVTSELVLTSDPLGRVLYAENNGDGLKTGEFYCQGELDTQLLDPAGGAIVYSLPTPPDAASAPGSESGPATAKNSVASWVRVASDATNIHVDSIKLWSGRLLCVGITGSKWVEITATSPGQFNVTTRSSACPNRPASPIPDLVSRDPESLGVAYTTWHPGDTSISNDFYRSPDGVNSATPFTCGECSLYSSGDITLTGGLSGKGGIFSTGNIVISGPTDFNAEYTIALYAAGNIILNGTA